jgi:hypothetical protein
LAYKPYTRDDLEKLICEVMGIKTVTSTIKNQINRITLRDNLTFKDIARSIVWYTEVAQKEVSPIYGIAFVPNVFPMAAEYFRKLELEQVRKEEEAKKLVEYQENNIIFNIKSLEHKKRKPKQLNIDEINVEGESDD